jgi:hypothetical protein
MEKKRKQTLGRRSFLKTALGSGVAFNAIGSNISSFSPQPVSALKTTQENKEIGRIIDTHIHLVRGAHTMRRFSELMRRLCLS